MPNLVQITLSATKLRLIKVVCNWAVDFFEIPSGIELVVQDKPRHLKDVVFKMRCYGAGIIRLLV